MYNFGGRSQNCEKRLLASSYLSVRLSFCTFTCKFRLPTGESLWLGSHWTDFHEIWYLINFRKSVEKRQVSLNSDRNNGYFTLRPRYSYDHTSLEREMFHTKVVQKIKQTYYAQSFFFRKSCRLWDNVDKYYRLEPATDDSVVHAHCMLGT